jgi:hypothetical protein
MAQHFYKYFPAESALISLRNGTLRWSTPRRLNDPWDIQFDLKASLDQHKLRALTMDKLWAAFYAEDPPPAGNTLGKFVELARKNFPRLDRSDFENRFRPVVDAVFQNLPDSLARMNAEVREIMSDSKILCLTTSPNNTHLWTHYADQHRGFALQFRSVVGWDSPWTEARPVRYVSSPPAFIDDETLSDILSGAGNLDTKSLSDLVIYTKADGFRYEEEWRIYSGSGRTPSADFEDIPFGRLELDAVIFGLRTLEGDIEQMKSVVAQRYPHAQILQARKQAGEFSLLIQQAEI